MFIQPCFIRNNTPELRKKLEELGYKFSGADHIELDCIVTFPHHDTFSVFTTYRFNIYDDSFKIVWKEYIDCGTNEELFLALSALRDDSDYMQWFISGNKWFKFGGVVQNGFIIDKETHLLYYKATVEEIIEHFKK
jgi:hypothetical protein